MIEDTVTIRVIRDAQDGNRDAMTEMAHSFQPVLFYIVSCHLKSDALIRETVKKLLGSLFVLLDETQDMKKFEARAMWMTVRASLNAALAEDTSRLTFSRTGSDPNEEAAVYTDSDEVTIENRQFTEKASMNVVIHMLKLLPDDQRMVFVMRYLDGFSFEKISGMLNVPEERLRKRAQLAKDNLARITGHPIQELFGIIASAEENKHPVLYEEEPIPSSVIQEQKEEPFKETEEELVKEPEAEPVKRSLLRWIPVLAAVLVAAVAAGVYFSRPRQTVSILSNATWQFLGTNGAGSAEVTIPETGNAKIDRIIETAECSFKDADGNYADLGWLHNGEELTYACRFDEAALKKAHAEVTETEISAVVENLPEPKDLDLFTAVTLDAVTDQETGDVLIKAVSQDPMYAEVNYIVEGEDEAGVLVYADISDVTLLSYGFRALTHYRVYAEEELPETIQPLVRELIIEDGLAKSAVHRDEYGFEVANGTDPEINALAQSFIGMAGSCDYVAKAFIYQLYGVSFTIYGWNNTYTVDEPEAGDLVTYYDSNGNFTHVATYLGNGLVLNGNYADGTAHITSMYESWYARNPMVFRRVNH